MTCREERFVLGVQMVLKCADIGHLAAAPRTHKRWAYQLEEEFFRQGDQERSCGLPLSPLMDRSTQGGMTRSQVLPARVPPPFVKSALLLHHQRRRVLHICNVPGCLAQNSHTAKPNMNGTVWLSNRPLLSMLD